MNAKDTTANTCDRCGYDLTGLAGAASCPECNAMTRAGAQALLADAPNWMRTLRTR